MLYTIVYIIIELITIVYTHQTNTMPNSPTVTHHSLIPLQMNLHTTTTITALYKLLCLSP